MKRPTPRRLAATLLAVATLGALPPAFADESLQQRYDALKPQLEHSPFGRPLLMQSDAASNAPHGEVYALIDQPFDAVRALQQPQSWCEVLMLQTNVKRCTPQERQLDVGIVRRYTDAPDDASTVSFHFQVPAAQADRLAVQLTAPEGPVGTRDYRLRFEAVPVGARQTFVHLSFAYETGMAARLATSAYLAGAGKDKVGFSTTGRGADGRPQYVGGIQGVAERNTMRYFLAIETFLQTEGLPPAERVPQRLRRFHAALERYPAQLHETQQAEYLAMKQKELK